MEVKIGVLNAPRELTVETDDDASTLASRLTTDEVLTFQDARGRDVLVRSSAVTYMEFGSAVTGTVGFRS